MFVWFSKSLSLPEVFEKWRDASANYEPNQPVDPGWFVHGTEMALELSGAKDAFEAAVRQLFSLRFLPGKPSPIIADFTLNHRLPAPGDRIVQRLPVVPYFLDAVVMYIVTSVWHETDRRGLTAVTSEHHAGMGEWTVSLSRKREGAITFMMQSLFKPDERLPAPAKGLARSAQVRFHSLSERGMLTAFRDANQEQAA